VTTELQFATAVIYTDDVAAAVTFHERATGLTASYYDRELGFALLGAGHAVAYVEAPEGAILGFVTRVPAPPETRDREVHR
jgi:hypothetical protein